MFFMAKIRVGSAVLVQKDGKLLLGISGKSDYYGALIIPGGGVLLYERFEDAAVREIREEAGIEIKNLRQLGAYQMIDPERENHRVIIYWQADWVSGEVRPSTDLLSAKFYSRAEIQAEAKRGVFSDIATQVLKDSGWL